MQRTPDTKNPQVNTDGSVGTSEEFELQQSDYAPKPVTAGQNLMLTAKIVSGGGIILFLIWLVEASKN